MYIHEFIKGIHNSVMDILLEGIYSLLASHISMYSSVASQRIHDAYNVIYVETMLKLILEVGHPGITCEQPISCARNAWLHSSEWGALVGG